VQAVRLLSSTRFLINNSSAITQDIMQAGNAR